MSMTAKVFMSGRSQAIRLPARLQMRSKEVRIEQVGSALWVQPVTEPESLGPWLQAFYAATPPLPDDFLADRDDPPPQERDWG